MKKGGYKFVRYADDFIVMTKTKEELPATLSFVKEVVEGRLGLKLSEDKTELTNFKRGFRFLGYDFIGRYKGNRWINSRRTSGISQNAHKALT